MKPVGQEIRERREERALSLEEVARATRIPKASLESIEAGRLDALPGEVYARGFLRTYARAVGLDPAALIARFESERAESNPEPTVAAIPLGTLRAAEPNRRFGVAIAVVLLLILFTLGLSIVLKPRGRDVPQELSERAAPSHELASQTTNADRLAG